MSNKNVLYFVTMSNIIIIFFFFYVYIAHPEFVLQSPQNACEV